MAGKKGKKKTGGKKRALFGRLFVTESKAPDEPDENTIQLFDDDSNADAFSEEEDRAALDKLTWEDGEPILEDPDELTNPPQTVRAQAEEPEAEELPEEIRLFDEDKPAAGHGAAGRTRIFRTGQAAVRIQMNETETSRRVEQAQKKMRANEAERRHQAVLEKQERQGKRKKFARAAFSNTIFAVLIILFVLAGLYLGFRLSDIVVQGNELYSEDYIVELSGLRLGEHMFFIDLNKVEENISVDPYMQVESVDYIFPTRIRIRVSEREEIAGIIGLDYNVIIDRSGYVLSMTSADIGDLLRVSGVPISGFQLGAPIGEADDFTTATLISVIDKLDEYGIIGSITSLDLTTPLSIRMYVSNGLRINLGQPTNLDRKMQTLQALLPQLITSGITTGTLYLYDKGDATYSPEGVDEETGTLKNDGSNTQTPDGTDDPNATPVPGASATPAPTATPEEGDPFSG